MIERAMKIANLLEQHMILDEEMEVVSSMPENEGMIAIDAIIKKIQELKDMLCI